MAYLKPSEYVTYGLNPDTSDAWIAAASSMIDAHCRRGSLLNSSYTERVRVSRHGNAQLTYGPVQAITGVQARYSRSGPSGCEGLAEYAVAFGLPGQWVAVDPNTVVLDAVCGELQLRMSFLGVPYSEVEVSYTAGFATVPDPVKYACAQIVKNAQATPAFNVRSSKLDTLQTEYFSDSLLDSQVRALLRPFVAERLG